MQMTVKRGMDVAVALILLLVLAPLMATIALLVRLDTPGPVFYRAERVGFRGRRLRMLKFRKMGIDAAGPALTGPRDARLTRVGRVLARTRLDELPQLWHVLGGQMSLVGPRPEDPRFVVRYRHEYAEILAVRPGLTGWAQIAFVDEARILNPDDPLGHYVDSILPQKMALDTIYAARPTLGRDLRILWCTMLTVLLSRPIAVNRRTGAMTLRHRGPAASSLDDEMELAAGNPAADGAAAAVRGRRAPRWSRRRPPPSKLRSPR
jgi:lipopolysaccharide/colanic/teichoic acid biosynthesis glycosyltransferase